MKVIVLYDFVAQPDTSELSINKDDILTVLRKDIGEGWWEGVNEQGQSGLFPAGYTTPYDETEPTKSSPPKELQKHESGYPNDAQQISSTDQAAEPGRGQMDPNSAHAQQQSQQFAEEPDWPDEDWEDEEDSGDNATEYGHQLDHRGSYQTPYYGAYGAQQQVAAASGQGSTSIPTSQSQQKQSYQQQQQQQQARDLTQATANLSISEQANLQQSGMPVRTKKNINRFSNFVKSGLERYILDDKSIRVPYENLSHIQSDPELGIVWKPSSGPYSCSIATHGKESKMKGFKTFISYDVRTSIRDIEVRRRYKHFDWLMQRLEEKYLMTPLPPLPEKQIAGRFHEDFVEHRRNLLQLWVNYVTRHPILSQCDVWWHFITCPTDDMKAWKSGKRKAEKDELVGANFFFSVEVLPGTPILDNVKMTKQLENFQRFVIKFDDAVKHLYNTAVDQSKKFSSIYSKDVKKLSESIKELSSAFQSGTAWRNSLSLNEAIRQTSAAYDDISKLYEEQPKVDFEPMADLLHQYKGLLAGWPEILQLHKNAINTRNEQERLKEEGKIGDNILTRVNQRVNVTTYTTLAEINHFHNERLTDFKTMMQSFLEQQINFYQDIAGKLQNALNKVNDA